MASSEEALPSSESNLTAIINTIPTAAWTSRPDGYCDFLNQIWLDYAGLTAEQAEVLRRRPDIIAAERRLAASNQRIGVAIAEYYPKISLAGVLGLDSLNAGTLWTGSAFQPAAVAGLRWRLFDFGRVDAEVKQARASNAEALVDYRQSVLKAARTSKTPLQRSPKLNRTS